MARNTIKKFETPNGDSMVDETNDALRVNLVAGTVSLSGADGALLDGVSASIKATVLDYASTNPLAVRLTDTNGDYAAAGAGTQYTEDAAAAADPIGSALILVRADTPAAVTSTDGDNIAARATNKGEQYVKHIDSIPVTDNSGSLTVDYATTGSGNATGALRVELANNGTGVIATVGAVTAITNALPAGTNAIGKLASNTGVTIGAVEIAASQTLATVTTVSTVTGGGIAHDGADSGNPIKIGAKAETSPKGITLVADGDRSDLYCDADGILIVKTGTAYADLQSERVSNTDGASTAFSTFGATANLRNFVTQITVHNAHATTNGYVDIRDGTAGSVLWTIPLPATGGSTIHFNPPLRQPTANTALAFDVSAAITTIYLSVNGFQSKA